MAVKQLIGQISLFCKGILMGAADVVPGVSGGTMAFVLGIYEELIESIHNVASFSTIKSLVTLKFKEASKNINWPFLLVLGAGIATAIVTLASFVKMALAEYPSYLWAFFFGLVLASIFTVFKKVDKWSVDRFVALTAGAVGAWFLVGLLPRETSTAPWFVCLCGALAICAMILPGISGSFILLLLGKYQYILGAVTGLKDAVADGDMKEAVDSLLIIAWTGLGAIIGLGTFVKVLNWLFKKYHDLTVAALIGFMIGSLRKIWPWKDTLKTYIDRHGIEKPLEQINVLPPELTMAVIYALCLALLAFVMIIVITKIAERSETQEG